MTRTNGFTLIELVMVIVVIGLLAAIAIPKFLNLTANARVAAGQEDLAALRMAAVNYFASSEVNSPGGASFPATKASLIAQLTNGLGALTASNFSYTSSTGVVACTTAASCS